jgi:hypothetical protein
MVRKHDQIRALIDMVRHERSPRLLSLRRSLVQDAAMVVRLHRQIADAFRADRRLLVWWRTLSRVSPRNTLLLLERVWLKLHQAERHRRHELAMLASLTAKHRARNSRR